MSDRTCDIAGCRREVQCRVRRAGFLDSLWYYVCHRCRRERFDHTVQVERRPKRKGR